MTDKASFRKKQQLREDLTGEHKIGDAGQLILAVLFVAVWIVDSFFLKATTFLNAYIHWGIRIPLGVVLLILAGYLAQTGLAIVFGEERDTPVVIRKSVFNVVRHPIYLSEILLYLGFLIMSISLAAVIVWIVAIVFLYGISRYEERMLLARFGKDYERYRAEVPMMIPRFWRRKNE